MHGFAFFAGLGEALRITAVHVVDHLFAELALEVAGIAGGIGTVAGLIGDALDIADE